MKFNPTEFPPTLFKYRAFNEYALKILSSNEIFFASPGTLNDPLDCALPVRYDIGNLNQMYKLNARNIAYINPGMPRKEIKRRAMEMARRMHADRNNTTYIKEYQEKTLSDFNRNWSVFSLSACQEDEVMWSHYGDSHTGFCVGFNTGKLRKFQDTAIFDNIPLMFWKVDYYDTLPTLNPYTMDDEELFNRRLFSKTSRWSYEEEYRLVRYGNPNSVVRLPLGIIESVTLGLKCSKENEDIVKGILHVRGDRIPLFRIDAILASRSMRLLPLTY